LIFFGSVFINEDSSNIPSLDVKYNINPSKSGGPDGCNPCVFAEVKDGLLLPLHHWRKVNYPFHGKKLM